MTVHISRFVALGPHPHPLSHPHARTPGRGGHGSGNILSIRGSAFSGPGAEMYGKKLDRLHLPLSRGSGCADGRGGRGVRANWTLACPVCRTPLASSHCPGCNRDWPQVDGIWRFLPPERAEIFEPFLRDYTRIRHAEGRGSEDPAHYLRLPDCDPVPSDRLAMADAEPDLGHLPAPRPPRLGPKILDLGAGVGWLSHRLAELGYQPCAVDVSVDDRDGLAAARHYNPDWPRLQAELDHLPLADGQADAAIFNASLHYSSDYAATLREARRVLRPGGSLVILESPIYRKEESGQRMVAERHADFERRFGTRSDALPSIEYLTWDRLDDLARELGIRWQPVSHLVRLALGSPSLDGAPEAQTGAEPLRDPGGRTGVSCLGRSTAPPPQPCTATRSTSGRRGRG